MSAYNDASTRQQDILTALGRKLGFSTADITSITYVASIPVIATLTSNTGSKTLFFQGSPLSGIITEAELDGMKLDRLSNRPLSGNVNSPGQQNRQTQSFTDSSIGSSTESIITNQQRLSSNQDGAIPLPTMPRRPRPLVAPTAFTIGQWSVANQPSVTGDQININIITLPADGGSTIIALQYQIDALPWIALEGLGTGIRRVATGKASGVPVTVKVRAVNVIGNAKDSDIKNVAPTAFAVPAAFTTGQWTVSDAAGLSGDQININIISLPSNGGQAITALEYQIDALGWITLSGLTSGLRQVPTGKAPGVTASVKVRAINSIGNGNDSDVKNVTPTVTAVPAAMTSSQWTVSNVASVSGDQISINITTLPYNGGSAITALEYQVDALGWIALSGLGIGPRQVATGKASGVAATVKVRAVNTIGAANDSDIKGVTPTAFTAPAAITAGQWTVSDVTSASGDQISINITTLPADGGSAITALEYQVDALGWIALNGLAIGSRQVSTGKASGVAVSVKVRAVNAIGNANDSDTKGVTPTVTITAPAAMTVGQWTVSDVPSASGDQISINITALPATGGSAITALQYQVDALGWITLSGLGTGARQVATGKASGVAANVKVRAVNIVGNAPDSDVKNVILTAFTTPAAMTSSQWTVSDVTSLSGDQISINITTLPYNGGSVITALQYQVDALNWITLSGLGTGARQVSTGKASGVAAAVKVRAVNAIGNASDSDVKNVTPTVTITAPAAMTVSQWTVSDVASLSGDQISINITALPADSGSAITALEYQVDALGWIALTGLGTGARQVATGKASGVAANVKVRAVNAIGNASDSDVKNVTPTAFTAPAAMTVGQWTVSDVASLSGDQITIDITALPATGGSAITALQYQVDALGWIALSGLGTGPRQVATGKASGVAAAVKVRAVNIVGSANDSDVKNITPTAFTAPAAMTVGQWTVTDVPSVSGDQISINITALPATGGSAITALEYQVDALGWIALSGLGTGARQVATGKASGVTAAVKVRAVNVVGNANDSDVKNVTPSVAVTIPAAMTAGQWTVSDVASLSGDQISINITTLPSDGNSAITALQYQVDALGWITLSGLGTGPRQVTTGLGSGVVASVKVRAVNAIGNANDSDTKGVTPTAFTAPVAMTVGQWTVSDVPSASGDQISINITALPADGGSAITALQYQVDALGWITLSGLGTGARQVATGKALGVAADVKVRAVNAIGNAPDSDIKNVVPTAPTGSVVYVGSSTIAKNIGFGPTVNVSTIPGLAPGDLVLLYISAASNAARTTNCTDVTWTALSPQVWSNDSYDHSSRLYYKVMGSTLDTNVSFSNPGSSGTTMLAMARAYRNVDMVNFPDIAFIQNSNVNTILPNPVSFTPATVGATAVVFGGGARAIGLTGTYTSLPGLTNTVVDWHPGTAYSNLLGVGDVVWSAGPIDLATWAGPAVTNTDSWTINNVVLRPATAAASQPEVFTAGMWTVTDVPSVSGDQISIDIVTLPNIGSSAITELQYQVNNLGWIALSGLGTGPRQVATGLGSGVAVNVMVRAVNIVGAADDSDVKNVTPSVAPTAPVALTVGQWTVSDVPSLSGDQISINITALPADGGSAITALQYQVDALGWIALSGLGTGARQVATGKASGVAANIKVRAVNVVGSAPDSDVKNVTPTVAATPAAMTVGQWTVGDVPSVSGDQISINITALPATGGSAITALEYQVDALGWIALTGLGTGARQVATGKASGVAAAVKVRAVNALGNAPDSDVKNVTPTVAAIAPSAMTVGQWTVSDVASLSGDQISIDITTLPATGGSAITALQYQVDALGWIALSGLGTGPRQVATGKASGVAANIKVRAVNAIGSAADSDVKNVTPTQITAPAAITVGQWTVTDVPSVSGDQIIIDITTLPATGGSAITALQYQVDALGWIALSGLGTGARQVATGKASGVAANIKVRAVNVAGPANDSDVKNVTPTVAATPAAMTVGQWTVSDVPSVSGNLISIDIVTLPIPGSSAITALQYQVDALGWITLNGLGTGPRQVSTGKASGVAAAVMVRAVNALGNAPDSDVKNVTPTVSSGTFTSSLVNEQGSTVITAIPAMRVRIDNGTWQTLTNAGITVSVVNGKLRLSGFTGLETSVEFHYEQQMGTNEIYHLQDTPGTTNITGTSINAIYAVNAAGPTPALGSVTPNFLPGLPIVSTRLNIPLVGS